MLGRGRAMKRARRKSFQSFGFPWTIVGAFLVVVLTASVASTAIPRNLSPLEGGDGVSPFLVEGIPPTPLLPRDDVLGEGILQGLKIRLPLAQSRTLAGGASQREWESLSPRERENLRRRMQEYKRMPPETRELYRKRYEQWKHLSPGERRDVQRKLQQWDRLSPREKENLRRRFGK